MSAIAAPLEIVTPLTLEGSVIRLEPVRRDHAELFWQAAKDALDDIFRWIPYRMKTLEDFERLLEKFLAEQERGESVVFATVERAFGRVIGSTRFMNIDRVNRRVEIGSTWIAAAWHRTAVNTEAKYLMLRHAFEVWQCMRVELKTDALNQRSRNAIMRIRCKRRRHLAQAFNYFHRPRARHGLLQHSRPRMAGSKAQAGNQKSRCKIIGGLISSLFITSTTPCRSRSGISHHFSPAVHKLR